MVVLNKGKKGKSKGKNMRGGAIGGIYEFTNDNDEIYFFSDLEGNMPDGIKELMFETTTVQNEEKIFEMDETGIIEKPKSLGKKVIVFTGDLIDRGEYSIRNLRRMLALKEKKVNEKKVNEGRVILLCGNRDTNKIRMYRECHIKAIEDNIFNNAKKKDINIAGIISELKDIISKLKDTPHLFTNNRKDIATIINIPGILKNLITPNTDDSNFEEKYQDDLSRIENMYLNTLGSPNQVKDFKEEFKYLFGIGNELDDNDTLLIFIAMMNMVMGKIWGVDVLPVILEPYNGLYIKYLEQCHIMASIIIGDKLCFVSHAGIPYKEAVGESKGSFYIPIEIGKVPSPTQDYTIKNGIATYNPIIKLTLSHYYNIDNIDNLNRSFTLFIQNIITNTVKDDEYKKYVAMSANCDILQIGDTEYSAYASPIVSRKTIEEVKDKKNLSLNKFIKEGTLTKKVYNIFGHQPSGALPYISKKEENEIKSYHIDLDISKAEDNDASNKDSYVYLKMTKDSDMLFGKTASEKEHDIINENESRKKIKDPPIDINYNEVTLDSYCENSIVDVTYNIITTDKKDNIITTKYTSTLFTVDIKEEGKEKVKVKVKVNEEEKEKEKEEEKVKVKVKVNEEEKEKEEEKVKGKEAEKVKGKEAEKVKEKKYYGMFLFTLVETNKDIKPNTDIETILLPYKGGRGKRKIYTKSIKRFLYGKRKMVIYVGKRGGEYVKVKGEYMSLAKFNKKINNKK
uniref:Calcineurin-like phosphoesterase domain-containing protein n=1 Tax=viral metagenome TaxID=1070528 RepID=A0A6C0LE62_9ZZZZ